MATSFKSVHTLPHSAPLTLPAGHHQPMPPKRLLDTHRQVWVSLLWGYCSFLLGPGVHKVLFVPSKSLFPSPVSSGSSVVGLMATSSKRAYAIHKSAAPSHTQICCTQSPCPCGSPLLTRTSSGDPQTLFWLSLCEVSRSWCTHSLFEPSECLWQVWDLILNVILPLYHLAGASPLLLDMGHFFWWGPTFSCLWLFSSEL